MSPKMVKVKALINLKYDKGNHKPGTETECFAMEAAYAEQCEKRGFIEVLRIGVIGPPDMGGKTIAENYAAIEELCQLEEVGEDTAAQLLALGIDSIEDVQNSDVETLVKVNGVGKATAQKIKANADEFEPDDDEGEGI